MLLWLLSLIYASQDESVFQNLPIALILQQNHTVGEKAESLVCLYNISQNHEGKYCREILNGELKETFLFKVFSGLGDSGL